MKPFKILASVTLSALIVNACTPPVKQVDKRPEAEKNLVDRFHTADSIYKAQINDIKKNETLETNTATLSLFVKDTLKLKADQWIAIVDKIQVVSWPTDYIDVKLIVPKAPSSSDEEEKYPQYSNVILAAKESVSNEPLKKQLKELIKGDTVLVTGTFDTEAHNTVNFTSGMDSEQEIFSNPLFDFSIKTIIKAK